MAVIPLDVESCAECRSPIPRNHTACVFRGKVVCERCRDLLAQKDPAPASPAPPGTWCGKCAADIAAPADRYHWHNLTVCRSCYNRLATPASSLPAAYPSASPTPSYLALNIVSALVRATGTALLLLGAIALTLSFARMASDSPATWSQLAGSAAYALAASVSGLLLLAAGEGLGCLRDIARNSFRSQ